MKHAFHAFLLLLLFTAVTGMTMTTFAQTAGTSTEPVSTPPCGRNYFRTVFEGHFTAGPGAKQELKLDEVTKGSILGLLELQNKGCEFRVHMRYFNDPPEGVSMVTPVNSLFSCANTETVSGEGYDFFDCRSPMQMTPAFGGYLYMDRISLNRGPGSFALSGSRVVHYPENRTFDTFDLIQPLGKGVIHVYAKR